VAHVLPLSGTADLLHFLDGVMVRELIRV
jgi:hypothetical protein